MTRALSRELVSPQLLGSSRGALSGASVTSSSGFGDLPLDVPAARTRRRSWSPPGFLKLFCLRARELLSLTWADVKVDTSSGGVISLAHTKVGQLNAGFEAGVMLEPMAPKWFERACAAMLSGTSEDVYMFDGGEARF